MNIIIRNAREEDAKEILGIYAYYVKHTAITFETVVPTTDEFKNRIRETLRNYPYLVAVVEDRVVGYVYASRFKERAAYDWSASTSIYIDRQFHRMGIGRKLYAELERILIQQNVVNLYAGAANPVNEDVYLTKNSEYFHEALGYCVIAKYSKCGNKFGRWYDLIEMEKIIGEHTEPPKAFVSYSDL